jgi:hypothetical protein
MGVTAVTHYALIEQFCSEIAKVLLAGCAPPATAASGDEGHRYVVSRSEPFHVRADRFDDPRALMTSDEGKRQDNVTRESMFVGVAKTCGFDLYKNVR